ncbi:MAG: histidine kinase [Candidatus Marinimicrobia bacterium]|nr:histidine kinase [Candidatus Neomarinimicrobiota bacterium]
MNYFKNIGGFRSILYTIKIGRDVGFIKMFRTLVSKNTCKTCALGMGGQNGGMSNEQGHWPEICKKSIQAMSADMQKPIPLEFFKTYSIDELKNFSSRDLEKSGRLTFPLLLNTNSNYYKPISWKEAYDRIEKKLINTNPDRSFFYFSGRSSNEAGFLLQLFARVFGTNHVNNCSYYCHQASGVGLNTSLGTGTATVDLEDLDYCDLFFVIGANPSSNHPRLLTKLKNIRKRGGKVIVINPVVEKGLVEFSIPSDLKSLIFGSKIASEYIQIKPGGDLALFSGLAKYIIMKGSINSDFIDNSTEGFDIFKKSIQKLSWKEIENSSGINREEIEMIGDYYVKSNNTIFSWCMGITHHPHGTATVQQIVNLALLRGMVGKKYAGLLPIRGHSNVQGIGSMGVVPKLKKEIFDRLLKLGVPLPKTKGYDTLACIKSAEKNEMDFSFCLGGNLYGSNPDSNLTSKSLSNIDTIVYVSTSLNTGHIWGTGKNTIILPVLTRDEEYQSTTQESMFNFIRLSNGGIKRHNNLRSEVEVIGEIGSRVLGEEDLFNWNQLKNHESIRSLISNIIPGFESIREIGKTKKEFHIPGRILHSTVFPTDTGKAKFFYQDIPKSKNLKNNQFQLISVRSEGQFNTVVYEDEDLYRGQNQRNVILMNKNDIQSLNLCEDENVVIKNEVGRLDNILVKPFDVKEGAVLMYYPEVNSLISQRVDPLSQTPGFKSMIVSITKSFSSS